MRCISVIQFYLVVILQYSFSCVCVDNKSKNTNRMKGETGDIKLKRQLQVEDYGSLEFVIDPDPSPSEPSASSEVLSNRTYIITNVTSTEINNIDENVTIIVLGDLTMATTSTSTILSTTSIFEMNTETVATKDSTIDTTVTVPATTEPVTEEKRYQYCPKHQKTKEFDVKKIADVWKIIFYTIPDKLKCFRLYIKKLSLEDQKHYESKYYGYFDDKVKWQNCILEISSSDQNFGNQSRKHFLQTNDLFSGVLDNIIIEEDRLSNTTILHDESPDQWLVMKNLLLMRDCFNGDVVVFSRMPADPMVRDLEEALVKFGEPGAINGTKACDGYILYR